MSLMDSVLVDISTTVSTPIITVEETTSSVEVTVEGVSSSTEIEASSSIINSVVDASSVEVRTVTIEVGVLGGLTPGASASVSGSMKLYSSLGQNTDGTITQKIITDALGLKVDGSQVLTDVPSGALFTDTVYDDTAIQAEVDFLMNSVSPVSVKSVTSYRSSINSLIIYSGYLLDSLAIIKKCDNSIISYATTVTDLETDWSNRLNLTYN
jgi:hypothetical protein